MDNLQDLCLKKIATSFERYYNAYDDFQIGMEFLQKKYSDELLQGIYSLGLLKEKYAGHLFNKYLKSLDTTFFKEFSRESIVEIFQRNEIGSDLEEIYFDDECEDFPYANVICHLPKVKIITCRNVCSDSVLQCIATYCHVLEILDVHESSGVTNVGINYLCQLKNGIKRDCNGKERGEVPCPLLKEIHLTETSVTTEGVQQLMKKLPLLQECFFEDLPTVLHGIYKENLNSVHKVDRCHLISLNVCERHYEDNENYDEIFEAYVTMCPEVEILNCCIYKLEHLNMLSKLPKVREVYLECSGNTSIDISEYLKQVGKKLTFLKIRKFTLSLSSLGQCYRLRDLIIKRITFRYDESNFFPIFHNLKWFIAFMDLSYSVNCTAVCRLLESFPALEELYLSWNGFLTSEVKTSILKLCDKSHTLKTIYFGGTVDANILETIILTCSTLEKLSIRRSDEFEGIQRIAETVPNRPEIIELK